MGLDMFLEKKTYVKNWDFQKPEEKHEINVKKGGEVVKNIDPTKIKYITEEVGYWRKANAIHAWFVKNVQGGKDECQKSYVSKKQLQELLDTVKRVLANPSLANELLPPQSGFFFGSTELDEWYFQDLRDTQKILEDALSGGDEYERGEFYYHASW